MTVKQTPILFPIVFGFFGIFLIWGCFGLWFKSSRVTVNNSEVTLQNRWLIFGRTRRFAADDTAWFVSRMGMTSGSTTYHDIKLELRANETDSFAARKLQFRQTGQRPPLRFKMIGPSGITVASSIASKTETEWLVREMNAALGKKVG
jgi:hypothetical protein